MLRIELNKSNPVYRPGEQIEGIAYWDFEATPGELALILHWHTEGKGDEDSFTAIEAAWTPSEPKGKRPLQWVAPRSPLSLDGALIRICWTLQFTSAKSADECIVPLTISHVGHPITLSKLPTKPDWFLR
jgi:hypothetical protein